ncbi:hypothetical protein M0805_006543 [Coniferiporia weirii]|nr:hypothetical protein M0805_006543 [Coniferiporia weirii]
MSSTYAYILDEGGGSNSPSQSMLTNDMDDDDDICPVCESECTCANRSRNITQVASPPPSQDYQNGYAPLAAPKINDNYASAHSLGHPSLKIKLTLPSKAQPRAGSSTIGKSVNVRAPTFKKKSKSVSETTFADGSVDGDDTSLTDGFFTLGQSSVSSGSAGGYLNADGSVPKKRGRPTKAVVAAREAAKVGTGARFTGAGIGLSMDNVGLVRHAKQMSSRKTSLPKSGGAKKKGKKLHGAAAASRAKAQLRRAQQQQQGLPQQQKKRRQTIVEDYESSELSELNDDEDERDGMHAFGLPTFISAFSSSSNGSSSDSDSDSETETDKETHFQHPKGADNPFKEANDHAQRKREHRDWEIHVRKRSVSVDGSSDADMGADSDDENEADEEEEDEEEGDEGDQDEDVNGPGVQRLMRYAGVATGWTDDEEDSFDADLFFANLSDSTADGSDNDEMGNAQEGSGKDDGNREEEMDVAEGGFNPGFDVMRLSEVAAAGFLAPFVDLERNGVENLPFGQGWDHLLLSNSLKDGLLGFDVSHLNRDVPFGQALDFSIPGFEDADAMMATSEEEEAVAMFDNDDLRDPEEEDGVEIFEDSDGGDTTEDEYVDVDGIATPRNMVLLRFPASLGAIDPMSTVSSPVQGRDERGRTLSTFSSLSKNRDSHRLTPKPGDILSGKAFLSGNKENVDTSLDKTSTTGIPSAPMMGSFAPEASNKTKRVVIADPGNSPARESVPCPYPAIRRLRRRADSLGMLSHNSDRCSGNSRRSSLIGSSRSPYEAMGSGFESTDDAEFQLAEPIKLDDVLDTALLESQPSDNPLPESTASETGESDSERDRHLQNLQRWDRIPIDAFRKTRVAGTVGDLTLDVDKMGVVPPTPRAPRPADGFSYGSAVGGMLRGSPLNTSFWESGSGSGVPRSGSRKTNLRGGRAGRMPVVISPVILPVRDGDSTPTNERHHHHHHHHQQQHAYLGFSGQHAAHAHAQNIKSRKELRKEKKRNRNFFGPSAASVRQHFPNLKNRSSSGMQRSNHGSSSIPSLSI